MDRAGRSSDWPPGGGDVAALVRAHDWAATPLGPSEAWPERLKAVVELVLASPLVSTLACGPERVFLYNDAAARLYDDRHPHVLGRPLADAFPDSYPEVAPLYDRAFAGEAVQLAARSLDVSRAGGEVFDVALTPLWDASGTVVAVHMTGAEVGARLRAEAGLRTSEERFRRFADASSDVLWIRDARTMQFEYVSPAFEAVYGDTFERVFAGNDLRRWAKLILPEDRGDVLDAFRRVRGGGRVTHEFRIRRPSDGAERWIRDTTFPLLDEAGRVRQVAGIGHDATDEKRIETALRDSGARLAVLVDELQHRGRNLLGVVRSVASKTVGQGASLESFENRLAAMSRAQGQLSRSGSDQVELEALVRAELEAHVDVEPPKVVLRGPKVSLTVAQVQTFALALHELATNAVKHGALRQEDGTGRLAVGWLVAHGSGGDGAGAADGRAADASRLVLDWIESGVKVPPDKARRRGFGRDLIERALAYSLGASTSYHLGPDGVRCRIELPLTPPGDAGRRPVLAGPR